MRLMLDTRVLLWWRDAARPLSRIARAEIADSNNEILVSIASLWEITDRVLYWHGALLQPLASGDCAPVAGINRAKSD